SPGRATKTVLRQMKGDISYRTVKDGFFVGEDDDYKFFPFPTIEQLEEEYFTLWRSALVQHFWP
ncbi:MAG TPA: hypothetical protein PLN01_03555, partial [Spirochaetota bacterium]|nr:hypothetical protein [Spirochaetota bacterium]